MPLDFERITLNAIPDGDLPVFHASQFETMRPFIADLKWGTEDFAPGEDNWCTLSIRKTDDTLVIIDDIDIDNNTISCILTQQSVACIGDNFCQLKVWGTENDEDGCIACLNFILHVQPDPEANGLTSESEIYNLTQQIEDIAQEVIGEDYYDKSEVDTLLAAKADSDSVYTKGETDTLLADKANSSDIYTKGETDTLLADKANSSDVYTKGETDALLSAKADSDDVYTKSETYTQAEVDALIDNIFPTLTASGSIATFTTALTKPLVSVTADVSATSITGCGVNLFDGEDVTTTTPANWDISFASDTLTIEHKNTYSSGIPEIVLPFDSGDYVVSGTFGANIDLYVNGAWNKTMVSGTTFSCTSGNVYSIRFPNPNQTTLTYKVQLEVGTTPSAYHPYTGNTVPVSDATTLVTQSGVNNVFADVGDVTVQYKYMSM